MGKLWMAPAILALASAVGCAGTYGVGIGYGYDGYYGVYTDVVPPRPLVEIVPPQPGPSFAWVNGYWGWAGNRYIWRRGYWDVPPPGHVWLRHGWVPYGGRYAHVPGRWAPIGSVPALPYVHPLPPYRFGVRYGVLPYGPIAPYTYIPPRYRAPLAYGSITVPLP